MKKIYLFGAILFAGAASFGQNNTTAYNFGVKQEKVYTGEVAFNRPTELNTDRALNILWIEDFTGSALTTSNGVWTTQGTDANFWGLHTGNAGSNGYGLSMNGSHLYWDAYTDIVNVEPTFASTPVDGEVISPTIDLTGYADVMLEFDLNAMFCCNEEPWGLAVSNDGGTTWSATIPLDLGLGANDQSNDIGEPVHFTLNISPYLNSNGALNNNVKVKFIWDGSTADSNGQYSVHYYWALDNLTLFEIPQYEVNQSKFWLSDITQNYEYTSFPSDQATIFTAQAEVINNGVNQPTNFEMEITTFDATNTIVEGPISGGVLTIPAFTAGVVDTITFVTAMDFSDASTYPIGEYTVRSVISYDEADDNTSNDTLFRTFFVTANTLGHVNYDFNELAELSNWNDITRTGAFFSVETEVELEGVDLFLLATGNQATNTTDDQPLTLFLDNRTDDYTIEVFEYTLEPAMMGDWYTFNLHQSENSTSIPVLEPGILYSVTLEIQGGNALYYTANLVDDDFSGTFFFGGDSEWYWSGDEPWMLLNFDESLTTGDELNNSSVSISQNVPNPFANQTTITYNLNEATNVSLDIIDVTGKVITSINEGSVNAGQHTIKVNGSDLSEGVYFYTFKAGEYSVTKRMVVTK